MSSETENREEKLTTLLGQLHCEHGIFERMVYKNKNQHRRSSYFQFLLKVRRDLKLLQSANLREILNSCFLVISGKRVGQKVHLLESLKKRKLEAGKYTFLERLLGVARLLSQMAEPMVKAATEISVVLARTFFMGFSITILALLARLRVLVQQILLDVVSVYNSVSSIAQSKQTVKINQAGLEVFREIFPVKNEFVVLECVWKSDKFVLLEKTNDAPVPSHNEDLEEQSSSKKSKAVRYLTVESFLGELETSSEDKKCEDDETNITDLPLSNRNGKSSMDGRDTLRDPLSGVSETPIREVKSASRSRKVAFVALKNHSSPVLNTSSVGLKESNSKSVGSNKKDSFFSLLAAGSSKESLF